MEEIEILFRKMMEDLDGFIETDEVYQEDMKDFDGEISLQWDICGIIGYQIFSKDNYSYKFGEKIDEPGVTLELSDMNLACKFFRCEPFEFTYAAGAGGKFEILHTIGWEVEKKDKGKSDRTKQTEPFLIAQINPKKGFHPFTFSKLPMFREWTKKRTENENEYGAYLPINQSLGTYENQVLPIKIFKHFIDRACNIVVRDCGCRVVNECKDHEESLGCMMMGASTIGMAMPKDNKGRVVTKEEALEHVRLSVENGLVPILGRLTMEAEGYDVQDTEHFLSCCFCCACCCINGKVASNISVGITTFYQRMEGIKVEVDEDLCTGCEDCMEACIFKGMEMIDEKARVNQKRCLGCGRCENACPSDAISITITDPSYVDKLIKKLEAHVDVS
jgi:UDP-glucose 4-epimerase